MANGSHRKWGTAEPYNSNPSPFEDTVGCSKHCPCCKRLLDFKHYASRVSICVFCSVTCRDNKSCSISAGEFVELIYNHKTYLVRKSEIDNKYNKVIVLPDGTAFDLTQMYVDPTDEHGNRLERPRLRGNNFSYEVHGQLPVIGIITAIEPENVKPDKPI